MVRFRTNTDHDFGTAKTTCKTQIALKFAKQFEKGFSARFWINGQSRETIQRSFDVIARRLLDEANLSQKKAFEVALEQNLTDQVVRLVKGWFSTPTNEKWLLVFDNVDNPKVSMETNADAVDIRAYFPEADAGSILVTTRSSSLKKIGKSILVKKLASEDDCITILESMSERTDLHKDEYARKLVKKLDNLPLALATAGAYLSQVTTSVGEYLQFYEHSWQKLQENSPQLSSYEGTMYTTWNISLLHIEEQSNPAARLLRFLAYFNNQDIWRELLQAGKNFGPPWFSKIMSCDIEFDAAMRIICDHGLVQGNYSSHAYSIHSCVHSWLSTCIEPVDRQKEEMLFIVCVGESIPNEENEQYWRLGRRLLPHAKLASSEVQRGDAKNSEDTQLLNRLCKLGGLFSNHYLLSDATAMFSKGLKICKNSSNEEVFGRSSNIANDMGNVLWREGNLQEAKNMFKHALEGHGCCWTPQHLSSVQTRLNLAFLYIEDSKLEKAKEMFLEIIGNLEEKRDSSRDMEAQYFHALAGLGQVYTKQRRFEAAELNLKQALNGTMKVLGPKYPDTLHSMYWLGWTFAEQSKVKTKLEKAEKMYRQAREGQEEVFGYEHPYTLYTINDLGWVCAKRGKLEEAIEMFEQAFKGYENVLGPQHERTRKAARNLELAKAGLKQLEKKKKRQAETPSCSLTNLRTKKKAHEAVE
ncbi:MAG: hypothetical protein Q9159_007284 [Coniocarpon cinnabarinum]